MDPELRELYVVSTVFGGPADKAGAYTRHAFGSTYALSVGWEVH